MPTIDFAFIADGAKERKGQLGIKRANGNVLLVSEFPATVSFDIVWRVHLTLAECGIPFHIYVAISDLGDNLIAPAIGYPLSFERPQEGLTEDGVLSEMGFIHVQDVPIEKAGRYQVILHTEGNPRLREAIYVVEQAGTTSAKK